MNLPPEPPRPSGGSDAEYMRWKKAHAQWSRMVRDAASDAERSEDEAIERARQHGDREFEQGVADVVGYSLDEIRDAWRNASDAEWSNMSIAERAAYDAVQRADNAWFFKAGAQRDAQKKIKKAQDDIRDRVSKGKCSLWLLAGLAVATLEVWLLASGAIEVVRAVTP